MRSDYEIFVVLRALSVAFVEESDDEPRIKALQDKVEDIAEGVASEAVPLGETWPALVTAARQYLDSFGDNPEELGRHLARREACSFCDKPFDAGTRRIELTERDGTTVRLHLGRCFGNFTEAWPEAFDLTGE